MVWENTGDAVREPAPLRHHGLFKPAELSHPYSDLYLNQQHLKTKKGLSEYIWPKYLHHLLPAPQVYRQINVDTESLLTYAFTGLNTQHRPGPKRGKR